MKLRSLTAASYLLLALVAGAVLALLSDFRLRHLDDPSQWGVIGFFAVLFWILGVQLRGVRHFQTENRIWLLFLVIMPVIYLADWFRFDGPLPWLWIELAGALVFWTLAVLAVYRSRWFLPAGILLHGVGWDLWHISVVHGGRIQYVPDWYAIACLVIDVAVAFYVGVLIHDSPRPLRRFFRRRNRTSKGAFAADFGLSYHEFSGISPGQSFGDDGGDGDGDGGDSD